MTWAIARRFVLPSLAVSTLYSYPLWRTTRAALTPELSFYRGENPDLTLFLAVVIHTLLIAAALCAVATLAVRAKPAAAKVADAAFICAVAFLALIHGPPDYIRKQFILTVVLTALVTVICTLGLTLPRLRRPFLSTGHWAMSTLALLPLIFSAEIGWLYGRNRSVQNISLAKSRPPVEGSVPKRLIWVVLDEFDFNIAIGARPPGLKLPVLDRLLANSVWGSNVAPAGSWTKHVIPAYLTGKRVDEANPEGLSDMRIRYANGRTALLSQEKTIFSDLKERGVKSVATAWYVPICRLLDEDSMDECVYVPDIDAHDSLRREYSGERLGLAWAMGLSLSSAARFHIADRPEEHSVARQQHMEAFTRLKASAFRQLANPSFGFLFLHFNVPHPLGIFDSEQQILSSSEDNTYLDNLILTDRLLGQLLESAQHNGVKQSAFLITSDHAFRPEIWNYRPTWSSEAPEVKARRKDPRVLFLFHDPVDKSKQLVEEPLNAVSGHDLALRWLDGTLQGHAAVANWLQSDKSARR